MPVRILMQVFQAKRLIQLTVARAGMVLGNIGVDDSLSVTR